jgi:hypothetical protein
MESFYRLGIKFVKLFWNSTLVIAALQQHESDLAAGALVVIDASKCRVRVLPLQPNGPW